MSSYYTRLGVEPGASQGDITAAYQEQSQRYAVERVAGLDEEIQRVAAERREELVHIYAVLSDPEQRQRYDASIGLTPAGDEQSPSPSDKRPAKAQQGLSTRERGYVAGGVLIALILVAVIWIVTDRTELPSVGEVDRPAPAFTLPALTGEEIQLQAYHGKVVLVNFWGTWCEPCKSETPALQSAYEQLNDQGLVIIGVNLTNDEVVMGKTEADIQAFAQEYQVTYPIALDVEGEVARAFQIYPIPTSYFIDTQGNIRYVRVGELTTEEVVALFTELKQESTAQRK